MKTTTKEYILLLILFILCLSGKGQTLDSVRAYIYSSDLQHKEIVLRQCIEETGHLKCKGCSMDINNLFGWYYKKQYIRFNKWQDSVDYYVRWQKRHYKGGDYYTFLKEKPFATNPNYISNLKSIKL
jgi:hypothetical protein